MTNKELLTIQDTPEGRKVLGEYVAELTVPKPWKHKQGEGSGLNFHCSKCGSVHTWATWRKSHCSVPDRITIDDSDACMGMAVRMLQELGPDAITQPVLSAGFPHYNVNRSLDENHELFCDWVTWHATVFYRYKIIALAIKENDNV